MHALSQLVGLQGPLQRMSKGPDGISFDREPATFDLEDFEALPVSHMPSISAPVLWSLLQLLLCLLLSVQPVSAYDWCSSACAAAHKHQLLWPHAEAASGVQVRAALFCVSHHQLSSSGAGPAVSCAQRHPLACRSRQAPWWCCTGATCTTPMKTRHPRRGMPTLCTTLRARRGCHTHQITGTP